MADRMPMLLQIVNYGEENHFSICFYSTIIFLISAKLINSTEVYIYCSVDFSCSLPLPLSEILPLLKENSEGCTPWIRIQVKMQGEGENKWSMGSRKGVK